MSHPVSQSLIRATVHRNLQKTVFLYVPKCKRMTETVTTKAMFAAAEKLQTTSC